MSLYADYDFVWSVDGEKLTVKTLPDDISNGIRKITMYARHKVSGKETQLYSGAIDVYDSANPDLTVAVAEAGQMYGLTANTWNNNWQTTTEYLSEYDGQSGVIRISTTGGADQIGAAVSAMHSGAYYEQLSESGKTYYVTFSFKVESTDGASVSRMYEQISGADGTMSNVQTYNFGAWQTVNIALEDFATYVEALRGIYEANYSIKGTSGNSMSSKGYLLRVHSSGKQTSLYITGLQLAEQ